MSSDSELQAQTFALHRALRRLLDAYRFRDRDRICCHDVSVTQCRALEHLTEAGPLTLNALAAALYLEKSTASRVVSGLEAGGYASRAQDPDDRRALRLDITPDGRALVAAIEADILAREARLLSRFSPEVRNAMTHLIGELARAQEAHIDTSGGTCCTVG